MEYLKLFWKYNLDDEPVVILYADAIEIIPIPTAETDFKSMTLTRL